jgi:MFS family permease
LIGILTLTIAFVFSQFYRAFLAVLTPVLSTELGATKADLSLASGAWFISFALFQFPVGIWLDRYGPRWVTAALFAVAAAGAFLFAAATAPWMLVLAMVLMGIGCSPVLMGAVFLIARNYRPAKMAMFTSWVVAFGSLGNVVSTTPLAAAAQSFGWRPVIFFLGIATLVSTVMLVVFVRNPRRPDVPGNIIGLSGYFEILKIRALWPIFPLMLVAYTAVSNIRGLWVGSYIYDMFKVDAVVLGNVSLSLALAMVVGTFIYGPLDNILRTRKWIAIGGQAICISSLATLSFTVDVGVIHATVMLVLIGLSGVGFGVVMAHGRESLPPHLIGRGVVLMNFCSIGGAGAMQILTGALVTATARDDDPAHTYAVLFGFYAAASLLVLSIYLVWAKDVPPARDPSRPAA